MIKTSDLFKINGKPMIIPDSGVPFSYDDLDSSESGRDESGYMHRVVLRYKVSSWDFNFSSLTEEEKQYNEGLFPDEPDFLFTHPSRKDATLPETTRCYRSKYGIDWYDAKRGVWKNYKYRIVEV